MKRPRKPKERHLWAVTTPPKAPGPLPVEPGDVVGYCAYFLHAIQVPPTDHAWRALGVITSVEGELARIDWEDGTSSAVLTCNLSKPGPNRRWAWVD